MGKRSFAIEQINRADGEVALVVTEGFADIMSQALLAFKQPWDGKPNPAVASLGQFIRDAAQVLRGAPIKNFPMLHRINEDIEGGIVCDETNYGDDSEADAE